MRLLHWHLFYVSDATEIWFIRGLLYAAVDALHFGYNGNSLQGQSVKICNGDVLRILNVYTSR